MISPILKRIAGRLPASTQHELRRLFFRRQIRRRSFFTDEAEYGLLGTFIEPGDWVLDIGANVGHYTMRMAELVGPQGRVIAFEPVPETFSLLAENVRLSKNANISLINVAVSDQTGIAGISIPSWADGLDNYYQAHVVMGGSKLTILTLPIDTLLLPKVKLAKIDVEGHELPVLRGMQRLLSRDHPVLIVETASDETVSFLKTFGYLVERHAESSNVLCTPTPHRPSLA